MSNLDLKTWSANKDQIALCFAPSGLKYIFGKGFTIPEGTAGLVYRGQDGVIFAEGGQPVDNYERVFLVKVGEIPLSFQFSHLLSKDDHSMEVNLQFEFRITPQETYLQLFSGNVLDGETSLNRKELSRYFRKPIKEAVSHFMATQPAQSLYKEDVRGEMEESIKKEIQPFLFDAGMELVALRHVDVFSESYEEVLERDRDLKLKQAEIKNKEVLQNMQKRLLLEEVSAKKEAEELEKFLAYQGLQKELDFRNQIKKKKQENKLQEFEDLYQKLGQDETKALIFLLEDEEMKAELINHLIERDMTEEQLVAKKQREFQKDMEDKLNFFKEQLNVLSKSGAATPFVAATVEPKFATRRVYVCCGQQVLSFDPKTNRHPEQPKELYEFDGKGLGYLRSVRVFDDHVLAGAQEGVYLWNIRKEDILRPFPFPRETKGRGGVNSALLHDDKIYASHSEQGIVIWDTLGISPPSYLLEDVIRDRDSVRGITLHNDSIYFSIGHQVCASPAPFEKATLYSGSETSITSFVLWGDYILAGNKNGRILKWRLDDPTSPSELNLRKSTPIYMLKVAEFGENPHLLVGAKDYGVHTVSLETELSTDFQSRDPIRWVEGASDFIYGVDRSGYKVHVWKVDKPSEPMMTWRLPDKVQDITIVTEQARVNT